MTESKIELTERLRAKGDGPKHQSGRTNWSSCFGPKA